MKKTYSDNAFWNGILTIGLDVYVATWNKGEDGKDIIKRFILTSESAKSILSLIYGYFVSKKNILAIEDMPVELLSDLESEALDWHPAAQGNALTKIMKSIWAMNHLLTVEN